MVCDALMQHAPPCALSVRDGDSLELVSLLERVRVGRLLGGVDQLVGEALGDCLDVSEGRLAGSCFFFIIKIIK